MEFARAGLRSLRRLRVSWIFDDGASICDVIGVIDFLDGKVGMPLFDGVVATLISEN
jgi:hypothetical protein